MPRLPQDLSRLAGALVLAGLQPHFSVSHASHLLLAKVPLVFGRHLGAERGAAVLGVFLGLKANDNLLFNSRQAAK